MSKTLRYLPTLLAILLGASLVSSCFDDEEYDITRNNDLIVSNVAFGTLPRLLHTKGVSGADSIVRSTVDAKTTYPLTIDHVGNRIFNADSLPYGIPADKIIFSAFTVADGTMTLVVPGTEKDTLYQTADTLDFSQGYRDFNLYGIDGTSRRKYRVEVRIHQQKDDSLTWTPYTTEEFWAHKPQSNSQSPTFSTAGFTFRLESDGISVSTDGTDFRPEVISDDDKDCLPTADVNWARRTSPVDEAIEEVFLYGTRNDDDNLTAHFWRRNIDTKGQFSYEWEYMPIVADNFNRLRPLHHAMMTNYDKGLILVGIDAEGKVAIKYSADYGRTWKNHSTLILKEPLKSLKPETLEAYVDADSNLWILVDGKDAWRGRAHKVGWNVEQHTFTK